MHTVKKHWLRPTLLDFNEWLKEKAEAHERMKVLGIKGKVDDSSSVQRSKTSTKTFSSNSEKSNQKVSSGKSSSASSCVMCKGAHPIWRCESFKKKTPTQRAKIVADARLCFSCLDGIHSFRNCPQPRKCKKEGCSNTHSTFLHGAERVFPSASKTPKAGDPASDKANAASN